MANPPSSFERCFETIQPQLKPALTARGEAKNRVVSANEVPRLDKVTRLDVKPAIIPGNQFPSRYEPLEFLPPVDIRVHQLLLSIERE
jgi:hypothetical protein